VLGVDGYNPSIIQYNVPPTGAAANAGECWVQDCEVHALCCYGVGCVDVFSLGEVYFTWTSVPLCVK
jgi:hypothetical protein